MAPIPNDALLNLKQRLRRLHNNGEYDHEIFVLQVLGVHRQIVDASFEALTGIDPGEHTECYDIVLTDGNRKLKCILRPTCNTFIQKGQITVGSLIQLTLSDVELHYNETDLATPSFVVIRKLLPYNVEPPAFNEDAVPHSAEANQKEMGMEPLASKRSSYLSTWCSEDPVGQTWLTAAPRHDLPIDLGKTVTLQHLAEHWITGDRARRPLIVRILHKSRLRHFGRPGKNNSLPFQAYLEIADRTGVASAVLWSSMCTDFYRSLNEGDTLIISNYAVKRRYQAMSKPTLRHVNLPRLDLEISLNKQGEVRGVKVVPPGHVEVTWQLPAPSFLFLTRNKLGSMPDEFNCDVAGIVTYVGRYERHRKPGSTSEVWLSRWIHLHDDTSQQPIRIFTFATSQPDAHRRLCPGSLCVLTQLRLCHNLPQLKMSRLSRTVSLTTTNESQLYVHEEEVVGPYHSHPTLKRLTRWRTCPGYTEMLSWRRVGGYYTYPPLPASLAAFKASLPDTSDIQVTPVVDLRKAVEDLAFRETKRIVIQGVVVRVKFVPGQNDISKKEEDKIHFLRSSSQQQNTSSSGELEPNTKRMKTTPGTEERTQQDYELDIGEDFRHYDANIMTETGTETPSLSFLPRRYDPDLRTDILSAINFPENHSRRMWSEKALADCPVVGVSGYFVVTISGLNRKHILHTLFQAPADLSQHASFLGMLSQAEFDHKMDATPAVTKKDVDRILKSCKDCEQRRLLFVLDLHNPGGSDIELMINRAFAIEDTAS